MSISTDDIHTLSTNLASCIHACTHEHEPVCITQSDARALRHTLALLTSLVAASQPFLEYGFDLTHAACHQGLVSASQCSRCGPILRLREAISPIAVPQRTIR